MHFSEFQIKTAIGDNKNTPENSVTVINVPVVMKNLNELDSCSDVDEILMHDHSHNLQTRQPDSQTAQVAREVCGRERPGPSENQASNQAGEAFSQDTAD